MSEGFEQSWRIFIKQYPQSMKLIRKLGGAGLVYSRRVRHVHRPISRRNLSPGIQTKPAQLHPERHSF